MKKKKPQINNRYVHPGTWNLEDAVALWRTSFGLIYFFLTKIKKNGEKKLLENALSEFSGHVSSSLSKVTNFYSL